jgi:two-component system response regulator VicR
MAYKILVVDDEKDVLEALAGRLSREGYGVVTALDGEEALLKVKSDNPDIILLDLNLPKKNGFEVLKEVREQYKDKWRPIIIISGRTELETVRQCYNLEADHYLTKPCTMDIVLRGIKTMISLIPARREV